MDNKIETTAEAQESAHLAELYAVQLTDDGQAVAENQITSGTGPRDRQAGRGLIVEIRLDF